MYNIINNKKYIIFFFAILITATSDLKASNLQTNTAKHNIKITFREFIWAVSHPFIVKKVLTISKITLNITDSLESHNILSDRSGGNLDAFKHSYWMAMLTKNIKSKKAKRLGIIHEKTNYQQFIRGNNSQDSAASLMDLKNNEIGIYYGEKYRNKSNEELINALISAIKNGELYRLKKDEYGNYLDCNNTIIDLKKEKDWDKRKCIIRTG